MSNVIDNSIFEAFSELDSLTEDTFKVDDDGIQELSDFDKMDDIDDSVEIIDDNAENEEDLDTSYLGKVVLTCNICGSKVFEDKENVTIDDEDDTLANTEVECPYCHTIDGFKIIGQIGEFCPECDEVKVTVDADNKDDVDVTVTDDEPNAVNESLKEDDEDDSEYDDEPNEKELARKKWEKKKSHRDKPKHSKFDDELDESFDEIEIKHDGEKIKVSAEPDESVEDAPTEEVIKPVDDETQMEINANDEEEQSNEPENVEVNVDEVDEDSLNDLGESYLKNVYDNVKSYRTTKVETAPNKLITEGIITFTSGAKKKTNFVFTPDTITKKGKTQFLGENLQITKNKKAFKLIGTIKNNKFLGESLNYNYSVKGTNGKLTKCYGTVKHK